MKDIVIVSGKRTPMAEYGGALRELSALELGGISAKAAIEQSKFEPREFDHAVFGNALQTSGDALYGARHVALKAGLPVEVPALTVNRLCGSGIQSIINGAEQIELGESILGELRLGQPRDEAKIRAFEEALAELRDSKRAD